MYCTIDFSLFLRTFAENIFMTNFLDFKFNKQILSAIADLGYETPTEIQQKAIPLAMAGHDLFGIAQTGTGKTAAYMLPILMKTKFAQGVNPRALILAPTRELAIQIGEAITELTKYTDLRHTVIYGGSAIKFQIEDIRKGIDILVATPGRLMDIYFREELILKDLKTLVLDEADRMMDMGFMPQIRNLLEIIPKKRQNMLFSATMPERIIKLSEEFLEFPMYVEASPQATTAQTIAQIIYEVPNARTKISLLEHLLQDEAVFTKVIVFTRTKTSANNVFKYISRKIGEDKVRVIHANKDQNARINAMDAFRNENVPVLIATDVVARGIDVSMVSHVINLDVPVIYEEYVHRIGRTGRAGNSGLAITFVNEAEVYHIQKIEKIIKMTIPREKMPTETILFETEFEEKQTMLMEIDRQHKKEDPTFQGAFHEKKNVIVAKKRTKAPLKNSKKFKQTTKRKK